MRRFILGTAGHIDHGKTALIGALTGVDTDRLPDEKRRGITIDLGFAQLPVGGGEAEIGIVDVPGHEGFIRNMLAGATGIDAVLLVVAADEGVMPQTREHLAIVELLGVRSGVVAVTKTDLVESEWLDLVLDDLHEQLAGTVFADAPILPVSSETGDGVDDVRDAIAEQIRAAGERPAGDLFRLPIDRVFTVRGTGTVVTGTVWGGRIGSDATVRLLPQDRDARIRGIQVHGRDVDEARAGQRAAVALADVDRDEIGRGTVVVSDEAWRSTHIVTARLRLLDETEWTVRPRQRIRFHLGTAEVMGRVVPLEGGELLAGDAAWVQIRLEKPVVGRAGDRFVIRSYSPITTIGGGEIAEPTAPKRKRIGAEERERFDAIVRGAAADAVDARIEASGWAGLEADRVPVETPAAPAEAVAAVDERGEDLVRIGTRVFSRTVLERALDAFRRAVEAHHREQPLRPGIDWEEVRRALPAGAAPELGEHALTLLLDEGVLERRGRLVARTGFVPELTDEQRRARDALLRIYTEAGLTPPAVSDLPAELRDRDDLWPLLKLLEYEREVLPLSGDLFASRAAVDEAVEQVRREFAPDGELLGPADFKQVCAVSRKYLIPLLEHFDRTGVTVRRGDKRVVRAGS